MTVARQYRSMYQRNRRNHIPNRKRNYWRDHVLRVRRQDWLRRMQMTLHVTLWMTLMQMMVHRLPWQRCVVLGDIVGDHRWRDRLLDAWRRTVRVALTLLL